MAIKRKNYSVWKRFGFGVGFDAYAAGSDDDWSEFRRSGIGGSDVAPAMGISPYRTALDVWLDKTGRSKPDDLSDNEAVYWGTVNEKNVAQRFQRDHPDKKVYNVYATLVRRTETWMHANLDRMVVEPDGTASVLEIKTASAYKADDWKDGVPLYYQTQVDWYLAVTGWKRAYVAVLIGGNDYHEYTIERDDEDVSAVVDDMHTFWHDFVSADVMPQVVGADMDSIHDMHPQGSDDLATPDDISGADALIVSYRDAAAREKQAKADKANAQAKLCAIIGDSKGIVTDVAKVTWTRSRAKKFDSKLFRIDHPDMWAKYQQEYDRSGGIRITEVK